MVSINAVYAQPQSTPKQLKVNGRMFMHQERMQNNQGFVTCVREDNRTIDGTCNNIESTAGTTWGATDIELIRSLTAAYGAPDFHNDMSGNCRLSARAISNLVCAQDEDTPSPRNLSSMVFTWGQFIDHDIDLTPEDHIEYVPILLPSSEPDFTSPIPFFRSEIASGTGVTSDRQQRNIITSWIDASQVYGSDETRAAWLRTFEQGRLKTSTGNLLPYNTYDATIESDINPDAPSMAGDEDGTVKVFVAGDVRANEQPGLTSLHTLFVREHNRICDQLVEQGQLNDEENYQRARKLVGSYMQSITYGEFLPALGVNVNQYAGYQSNNKPDISNLFASAAYRIGHTMVTSEIPIISTDCTAEGPGSLSLLESFFNPEIIATYGVEPLFQGLSSQTQQKVDAQIVDDLRNFLFTIPNNPDPFGLDLASLNIQRGRDHGLPDYNTVRAYFTGLPAEDFSDITSDVNLQQALESAYGSVYDMDVWVGLLSEDPLGNSSVGITMNAILSTQFQLIRDGDFYYYLNDPAFSDQQRNNISNTDLRDILLRNTTMTNLQNNVFFAADCDTDGGGGGGGGNGGGPGGGGNGGGGGPGGGGGGPGGGGPGGGGGLVGNTGNIIPGALQVYPNPSSGQVNLSAVFEQPSEQLVIKVQHTNGKTYYNQSSTLEVSTIYKSLDLDDLPPGIYFISVQSGSEIFTEKVVIN